MIKIEINSLKEVRQNRGLTQQALADLIGVSRKRIYLFEVGEAKPVPNEKQKLCIALHLTAEELEESLKLVKGKKQKVKSNVVTFRATDELYEKIVENARQSNMKIGTYVAKTYEGGQIKVIEGLPEFTQELRRIGVNLNQLTKLSHVGKIRNPDLKPIQNTINEIYIKLNRMLSD
ncbi:plasmid mobilization protein [Acetobacterium woodii]|uniref:HTH cro/C1-type domain-containing protein n=1 Tax=Acetobacterium woodii (strain ATCC 29683 / DSM 1030 / JCM 2381 / KCTC 1655 / WB1) TaxID=931626 RepID=H6LDD8_ACEWD|nr:helix-turn-helix domain-containing protein [Acetobacterium woodii]AFA47910.1 hypothetical protein Awo_c11260 [Acetobacterium woodii DSM 1030]